MNVRTWHYLSSTGANFLCLVLGIGSGILSARLLGPEGRGELALILYFPGLLAAFLPLGLPEALGRLVHKQGHDSRYQVGAGLQLALAIGVIGPLLAISVLPAVLDDLGAGLTDRIVIVCLVASPFIINTHLFAVFRNLNQINFVNLLLVVQSLGYILALMILCFLDKVCPFSAALASIITPWIVMLIGLARLRGFPVFEIISGRYYLDVLRLSFKYFLPALGLIVYGSIDRALLLQTTITEQIGYYAVAVALTHPLSLLIEAFSQIGFIEVAELRSAEDQTTLMARRFCLAQVLVVFFGVLLAIILYPVIRIGFGVDFVPAFAVACWLLPAVGIMALNKSLDYMFRAKGEVLPGIMSSVLGIVLLAILSLWWCPKEGAVGFGKAMFVARFSSLMVLLVALKNLKVRISELWGFRRQTVLNIAFHLGGLLRRLS